MAVIDCDIIEIIIERNRLEGTVNLIGHGDTIFGAEEGTKVLSERSSRHHLTVDENLPDDTRLWAALQSVSGGTWGGCVDDVDAIVKALHHVISSRT